MPKIVFPLEAEINRAKREASDLLLDAYAGKGDARDIADKYHKAISQIAKICEDRKRF